MIIALGIVCAVDMYVLSGLISPIRADLGLNDEAFGRITAFFTIGAILGGPVFGYFAGLLGRKPVLIGAVLFWSCVSALGATASGLAGLLLWRCLTGVGESAYQSLAPGWIGDLYDRRWRNLAFSLYMVKNKIGASLALAIGAWIAARYGWRAAMLLSGLPGVILAIVMLFTHEPAPGASDGVATAPRKISVREQLAILRIPAYTIHLAALACFFSGTATALIWSPTYLHRVFGMPNQDASSFLAAAMLSAIPLGLTVGYLVGRFLTHLPNGQTSALTLTTIMAAAFYASAFAADDIGHAKLLLVVAILWAGSTTGSLTALLVESVPAHLRSAAGTIGALVSSGLGNSVGPWLLGALSDRWGLERAIYVGAVSYALAGLIWLIASIRAMRCNSSRER